MELAQARKARIVTRTGGLALADALVAQGIDHVSLFPARATSMCSMACTTCARN